MIHKKTEGNTGVFFRFKSIFKSHRCVSETFSWSQKDYAETFAGKEVIRQLNNVSLSKGVIFTANE